MNIISALKNLFRRPPEKIKVVTVSSHTLRLAQWRQADQLVVEAVALARNPTYVMQLQVLKNEHLVHTAFPAIGVSPTDRIVHQAKCEGYELALNNLEAMTKPMKATRPLEATFAAPEETTKRK